MFTIKIKTKSTKKFTWNSSGVRGFGERTVFGLHETVVEAVNDFRDYVCSDGGQAGVHACLVTWEDGDELRAFILPQDGEVPAELPWILMRSKPEHLTRKS